MKHEALREVVARVMWDKRFGKDTAPHICSWESSHSEAKERFISMADAAIFAIAKVLAEPTPEMVKACLVRAGISPAEANDRPLSMAIKRQYRCAHAASPLYPEKNDE